MTDLAQRIQDHRSLALNSLDLKRNRSLKADQAMKQKDLQIQNLEKKDLL
jgi:hypothetical protein